MHSRAPPGRTAPFAGRIHVRNSNAFMSVRVSPGDCFFVSADEEYVDDGRGDQRRWSEDRETATKGPIVCSAAREPSGPACVEVRIVFGLQRHEALTEDKALVRARPGRPKAQKSRLHQDTS